MGAQMSSSASCPKYQSKKLTGCPRKADNQEKRDLNISEKTVKKDKQQTEQNPF